MVKSTNQFIISLGKKISTKALGSFTRQDLTNDYKYAEGSILERAAVKNALLKVKNPAIKEVKKGWFFLFSLVLS